jgi:hypothetical protein
MFISPQIFYKNKTFRFLSTDTEDLFRKNLKKQHYLWTYRRKQISYSHNEFGFRSRSFENLDWANAVVVFGCSNVYGTGLAHEDCVCSIMEEKLGRPVINFGIHGGSVELAFYNSLILCNNFTTPAAVVHLWTSLDRYTDITDKVKNVVPIHDDYFAKINWNKKSEFYVLADRTIWKNKTVYYESSFWNETADTLNIDRLPPTVDSARDLSHPGIETNKLFADFLVEKLKNRGLK